MLGWVGGGSGGGGREVREAKAEVQGLAGALLTRGGQAPLVLIVLHGQN